MNEVFAKLPTMGESASRVSSKTSTSSVPEPVVASLKSSIPEAS